jgi:Domain of unknown function (DUF4268)
MALVRNFERKEMERNSIMKRYRTTYTTFERDGRVIEARAASGATACFASGKPGLSFQTTITHHAATAQLVIDRGKDSDAENRAILDQLKSHKAKIEQAFGASLMFLRVSAAQPRMGGLPLTRLN